MAAQERGKAEEDSGNAEWKWKRFASGKHGKYEDVLPRRADRRRRAVVASDLFAQTRIQRRDRIGSIDFSSGGLRAICLTQTGIPLSSGIDDDNCGKTDAGRAAIISPSFEIAIKCRVVNTFLKDFAVY